MIRFEVITQPDGNGKTKVEIKGDALEVRAELTTLMKNFVEKHPELVGSIFLGLAVAGLEEDDVLDDIHSAYKSVQIAKALKGLGGILDVIEQGAKQVDKNDEKCKNCNDKGVKKDIKSILNDILTSFNEGEGDE